jgi:hypothetical protein
MAGDTLRKGSRVVGYSRWILVGGLVLFSIASAALYRLSSPSAGFPFSTTVSDRDEWNRPEMDFVSPVVVVPTSDRGQENSALTDERSDDQAVPRFHPVVIHHPVGPPRVATGETDPLGNPVTVSCASCHTSLTPNPRIDSGDQLTEFHQGLVFQHGQLTCLSCHHADDYSRLRLADGRPQDVSQVQLVCSQCHASQARDYEHGAHGGMYGYWDLTRGPRQRKNCIDCHDPHAPAFPRMLPSFRPHDRFLSPRRHEVHHE